MREEAHMKCPFCHNEIDNDSVFCPLCGKAIDLVCPKCGKNNSSHSKFCKYCGEPLEAKEEKDEAKPKKNRKESASRILSIIAMSAIIFSMVLVFGLAFAPFLQDSFFPVSSFTVIGYAVEALKPGFKALIETKDFLLMANSGILILLLTALVVLSIVALAKCIPLFVKSLKEKKYTDFTKSLIPPYVLFVVLLVYFRGFAFSEDVLVTEASDCAMFVVHFVFLLFAFNIFVKEFNNEKHNYALAIARGASRVLIFAFVITTILCIGGYRYSVRIWTTIEESIGAKTADANNLGVISILVKDMETMYPSVTKLITEVLIVLAIPVMLEFVMCGLGGDLLKGIFSQDLNKPTKNIKNIVYSSIMLVFSIADVVLLNVGNKLLNKFDNLEGEGIRIISAVSTSTVITMIVFSVLLLANAIAIQVVESINKGKEEKNEEAK